VRLDAATLMSRRMFLSVRGEGAPPVVFEPGDSESSEDWVPLQDRVARFTRACRYDRAGLGRSDARDPGSGPATSETAADEVARLLTGAGIDGPWVVVAHSLGALHARVLAARRPELVGGLVLLDPAHEDGDDRLRRVLSPRAWEWLQRGRSAPGREHVDHEACARQARAAGTLGDRPLVVVSALDPDVDPTPMQSWDFAGELPASVLESVDSLAIQAEVRRAVHTLAPLHEALAALSTRGRLVRVPGAEHRLHRSKQAQVVAIIQEVVHAVSALRR
jgi:pimeloyl-ACP methyl ester carboxylesterase